MRIAVLAHVRHPIAEPFQGGMEAHSFHLVRGLVARGHDVTLFAAGDSDAGAPLFPILDAHYDARYPWHQYIGTNTLKGHVDAGMARAMGRLAQGDFDVIHNNTLHRYPPRLARSRHLPMLTSLHVPPFDPLSRVARDSGAPWSRFTVTSHAQLRCWWPEGAPDYADVVFNGIDLTAWQPGEGASGRLAWAGRITPNKGAALAVQAAILLGMGLDLYGSIEDRPYFDAHVAPYLGPQIRHHGLIDASRLAQCIGEASAFLFTPLWEEPFGLVAAEAMACATPVAATPFGAVPEVIGTGAECGGIIAEAPTAADLAQATRAALSMDRGKVRDWAEQFGQDRMLDRYEALYREVIAGVSADTDPVEFPELELAIG